MTLDGQYRGVKLDGSITTTIQVTLHHQSIHKYHCNAPKLPQDTQIENFLKCPKKNLGYVFGSQLAQFSQFNRFWYYFEHILQKSVDLLL